MQPAHHAGNFPPSGVTRLTTLIRAIAATALLCAPFAHAAVTTATHTTYQVRRGSSNLPPAPTSEAECIARAHAAAAIEGETREKGANDFQCHKVLHVLAVFSPNPPPTCPDKPADEQRPQTCPAGTVGTWLQDKIWTLQPAPTCWVQDDWTPTEPPAGMCAPADSDADGVPDSMDECPTVYASTPNGCPATPPEPEPTPLLRAPTSITATGISTSDIRVEWGQVSGSNAYSLERCIGATCTTFSQLVCTQSFRVTHSHLPADLTARYRVRASRDTTCSATAGNLGEYSAIVNGTTLGAEPEPTGEASLSWTPPTQNTDGSALTDLAGYRIHYGLAPGELTQTVLIAYPGWTRYTIESLTPGTYYFAVRAYTAGGTESEASNVTSKVIH